VIFEVFRVEMTVLRVMANEILRITIGPMREKIESVRK